jgi:hypothetical protein
MSRDSLGIDIPEVAQNGSARIRLAEEFDTPAIAQIVDERRHNRLHKAKIRQKLNFYYGSIRPACLGGSDGSVPRFPAKVLCSKRYYK